MSISASSFSKSACTSPTAFCGDGRADNASVQPSAARSSISSATASRPGELRPAQAAGAPARSDPDDADQDLLLAFHRLPLRS